MSGYIFGTHTVGESLLLAPRAAWDAANHPTIDSRDHPTVDSRDPQKSIQLQMSTLPRLKNPASSQQSLVKSIQINDKYKFIINW